jgi:Holliday junction resolvase RusA-like endonuclease
MLTMTRRVVTFEVIGIAQPKGSMKAFVPKGWDRAIVTSDNPKMKDWQQRIAEQAQTVAADGQFVGPVAVSVVFHLPRPASLPKRVRHHVKKPDLDKLVRCLKDGLRGVLYHDDSQVTDLDSHKRYAVTAAAPRACITVAEADPQPEQSEFALWPAGSSGE